MLHHKGSSTRHIFVTSLLLLGCGFAGALALSQTVKSPQVESLRQTDSSAHPSARIQLSELRDGGPPEDGIPSIDNPRFDMAQTTPFPPEETIVGVVLNGEAKAYPYGILNWHEIVNDRIGGINIAISYCPLCDTILAFGRGQTTFGVSGKLYQSCLIMFDRRDKTLFAQPWGLGVVGPQVNHSLEKLPAVKTTLQAWLKEHPNSKVLSPETGHQRDYFNYPYGSYLTDDQILFPARNQDRRNTPPKETISYIWEPNSKTPHNRFSGHSLQVQHRRLAKVGQKVLPFGDRKIRVQWHPVLKTVVAQELDGTPITSSTAFAFVYPAFFDSDGGTP